MSTANTESPQSPAALRRRVPRDCLKPPISDHNQTQRRINFRHPAYPDTANKLLVLDAVDDELGFGVDYDLALLACGLVANNRWHHGWFGTAYETNMIKKVQRPANGILPCPPSGQPYYFFVGSDMSEQYPVVPSFEHWRFPHDDLPDAWKRLSLSDGPAPASNALGVYTRDRGCCITGSVEAADHAHLVPLEVTGWFNSNDMDRYCARNSSVEKIDDDANIVMMRKDVHFLFDQKRFAIVPKSGSNDPVVHVLNPGNDDELYTRYHNRRLQPPRISMPPIRAEFLFARFAWAIFCDEAFPLLRGGLLKYQVIVLDPNTGERKETKQGSKDVKAVIFPRPTRTRSISPSKRKLADLQNTEDDHLRDDHVALSEEGEEEEEEEEEPFRGRSRFRDFSSERPDTLSQPSQYSSHSTVESPNSPRTPSTSCLDQSERILGRKQRQGDEVSALEGDQSEQCVRKRRRLSSGRSHGSS